jgi:hypothetical protein
MVSRHISQAEEDGGSLDKKGDGTFAILDCASCIVQYTSDGAHLTAHDVVFVSSGVLRL